MKTQQTKKNHSVFWKISVCVSLSAFYIAMLAWPFGLSEQGYVATRALLAGAVMFAFSVPAWIINIKREFFSDTTEAKSAAVASQETLSMGQVAMQNKWLNPAEVRQIMYCQKVDGKKFGQVAVKRNFLTLSQVKSILTKQSDMKRTPTMATVDL
jgi:hypothetical protein